MDYEAQDVTWLWTLATRPDDSYTAGGSRGARAVRDYAAIAEQIRLSRAELPGHSLRAFAKERVMAHSTLTAIEHGSSWPDLLRLANLAELYGLRLHVMPTPEPDGSWLAPWAAVQSRETWRAVHDRYGYAVYFTARALLAGLELHRQQADVSRTALARQLGTPVNTIRNALTGEIGYGLAGANEPFGRRVNARTAFAIAAALGLTPRLDSDSNLGSPYFRDSPPSERT